MATKKGPSSQTPAKSMKAGGEGGANAGASPAGSPVFNPESLPSPARATREARRPSNPPPPSGNAGFNASKPQQGARAGTPAGSDGKFGAPGSPPAGRISPSAPAGRDSQIAPASEQDQENRRASLSPKTPSLVPSVLPVPRGISDMLHPEDAEFRERAAASTTVDVSSAVSTFSFMAAGALAELHRVFNRCDMMKLDPSKKMVREIMLARGRNIVLHGVGREGLMMRGFAMRLFHLGLKASCLGDMTTPKLGPGDLFIASAGPGTFSSVNALMLTAKEAGAKVLLVTGQPDGDAAKIAHEVAWLPAQTMKDEDPEAGQLPADRPWDRYAIPGRPLEQLHAFHRSFKPVDILGNPLPESAPAMMDKRAKEEAKIKEKKASEEAVTAGKGPKDYSKVNKEIKEKKKKKKTGNAGDEDDAPESPRSPSSPKSPKSPKSQKGKGTKPKGELGVGALPGKEKTPHYMVPLEGGHIDREVIQACKGDPEYICLLADNKILPMGSVYEGAMYILFEIVTYMLRVKLGETIDSMCERHTNME